MAKHFRRLYEADEEVNAEAEVKQHKDEVDPKFTALVDKLRKIDDYKQFVDTLAKLSAEQKQLFVDNFGDGDAIKPDAKPATISVSKLLPTQNQVAAWNSLDRNLASDCSKYFSGVPDMGGDILTFAGKYVIDGHHRWSQVFAFNPKAKIGCMNFKYQQETPITNVLKDFQAGCLASRGAGFELKGGDGVNLFTVSKEEIRKYIADRIKEPCWQSIVKAGKAKDEQSAIDYLVRNIMLLQKKCQAHAATMPERQYMPQTAANTAPVMKQGITDMSEAMARRRAMVERIRRNRNASSMVESVKKTTDTFNYDDSTDGLDYLV